MRLKQLDIITTLLLGFGLILVFLYLYLIKIDRNIKNYSSYHNSITELKILDKEFNNFLLHKLTFTNYDTITAETGRFCEKLDTLRRRDISKEFTDNLTTIDRLYQQKFDNIEFFKSSNASAINSLNYLFDLNRAILKNPDISKLTGELTTEILFMLLQIFTQVSDDTQQLNLHLQNLHRLESSQNSTDLYFFSRHSEVARKSFHTLKQLSDSTDGMALFSALNKFDYDLDQTYKAHLFTQKIITSLFFLSTFVILIILIIMHLLICCRTQRQLCHHD
jgi:ABC-type transporter Mla MlaB component